MEQLYGTSAGQKSWQFKRDMSFETEKREPVPVSDDARAVASAELAGEGSSTARSIIDAAREYSIRELDHLKAAELLEIARKRIDRDQIQRKIDLEQSQKLDEECMFLLAESYEKGNRLTLSFNIYSILKERLRNTSKAKMVQFAWAGVAYKLGEALYGVRRFQEAFDIFEMIHGGCDKNIRLVIGNDLFEEAMLQSGLTLQQLKRLEEAEFYFKEIKRSTQSATRKAQAQFCADVMEAQQVFPDQRLDAAHEIWEQNFVLPRDSYSGRQTGGGGRRASINLSPSERAWKEWSTQYWEERLKSPLYYAFLVLFVTWPFAIPVVSIAKRSGFEGFFV
jgi:tetratricopeptide (TPR) repeat protein